MTNMSLLDTAIERRYRERSQRSRQLMERAAEAMPGGNTRTTSFHPPYPVVFERGAGAWLWDIDGHRYLDLFYNGLSLIHGHAYEPVRMALEDTAKRGTAWSGASREQIEFAELLRDRIGGGKRLVRFANTGSEAGMMAVKIARAFTGRPYVVKFDRAYHGSYPDLEAGLYGQGGIEGRVLVATFNDIGSVERALESHQGQVAAIMYEPIMFTGRVIPPAPGFLQAMEALAQKHGVLTILDDCLMLRLAVGGSSEKYGLKPDLVVLGKFVGGGTPVGAIVGREEIMASVLDPRQSGVMFHGGSFNGNVLGCAAGLAAMRDLDKTAIDAMDARMTRILDAIRREAAATGFEVTVSGEGSVGGIAFAADTVRHEDDPSALGLSALFYLACLNEGIAMGPGCVFALATAVDDEAVAHAEKGYANAFRALAEATR